MVLTGGADADRTRDLLNAIQALSQPELQPHRRRDFSANRIQPVESTDAWKAVSSLQLFSPIGPIDFRGLDELKIGWRDLIGEQDQIVARPAGVRGDDAIEPEEIRRITDRLSGLVQDLAVSGGIDTERNHRVQIGKPESLRSPNFDPMQSVPDPRRADRLTFTVNANLSQGSIWR